MSQGIYSAASGAVAQERNLDIVANNVANTATTGFRADRVSFQEVVAAVQGAAPTDRAPRQVALTETRTDTRPGALRRTGDAFDLALDGGGYFAVWTAGGERYTRAGAFSASGDGVLRTPEGHAVSESAGGPAARIEIPAGTREVVVGPDGTVRADGSAVGTLRVVRFEEPGALTKEGATLYVARDGARPDLDADTRVVQGVLESSNVNAVTGLTELIQVSRGFEAFQKLIDTFRQLDERTARELGARGG